MEAKIYIWVGTIEHCNQRKNVYLRGYQRTQSLDISVLLLDKGHHEMPDIKIVGQIYLITAGCNSAHSLWWRDYQPSRHQVAYPRWSSASPSQPEIIQEVMQYSPPQDRLCAQRRSWHLSLILLSISFSSNHLGPQLSLICFQVINS